jgi:hypothetical protein
VVDPASLLCDDLKCMASRNGVSYYFDDDHLSLDGARLVAAEVLRRIDQAR